jgi:hypothetical protein
MKTHIKKLLLLAIAIILIQGLMAQEQTLKYNVRVLGMDVGVLTVSEWIENGDTIVEALTDVKVRIVFSYKVKYVQKCIYRNGELLNSSLLTYKKDRLNSSTYFTRKENGYDLVIDDESSFLDNSIKYSGSLLYFHEPSGIKELYYEISGERKPIASIGAHTYQVIDPDNGRESIFEYEDGKLKRSSVEHGIATIYTERLSD